MLGTKMKLFSQACVGQAGMISTRVVWHSLSWVSLKGLAKLTGVLDDALLGPMFETLKTNILGDLASLNRQDRDASR